MEKKKAHYPLDQIQALVQAGAVQATRTALGDAAALGLRFSDMKDVIKNLKPSDLYKSMTSHYDNKIWQDVYHYPTLNYDLYIKLQKVKDVVIVSFKER